MTVLASGGLRRALRQTQPRRAKDAASGATDAASGATDMATGATDASVSPPLLRFPAEVATDAVVLSTRRVCRSIS
jgi:X-X-X-Leu-X-X-Gly heptad repeat protein